MFICFLFTSKSSSACSHLFLLISLLFASVHITSHHPQFLYFLFPLTSRTYFLQHSAAQNSFNSFFLPISIISNLLPARLWNTFTALLHQLAIVYPYLHCSPPQILQNYIIFLRRLHFSKLSTFKYFFFSFFGSLDLWPRCHP